MSRSLFLVSPAFIKQAKLTDIVKKTAAEKGLGFRSWDSVQFNVYNGIYDLLEIYLSTESEFQNDLRAATFGEGYGHLFMIAIGDRSDGSNNKILIPFLKGLLSKLPLAIVYNEEAIGTVNVRLFDRSAIEPLEDHIDYYEAFYKA